MVTDSASAARLMTSETVAVLGAGGDLGFPVARNLARAGIAVRAWDFPDGYRESLARDGAYVADSPGDAARGAGIVLTMLPGPDALVAVMEEGVLARMRETHQDQHTIWLQLAPIGEAATQRCIWLAGRYGVGFVDAPVLGNRGSAEQGTLIVLESGPEEARPRVQPLFDVIGQRTIRAGQAGAGARLKDLAP